MDACDRLLPLLLLFFIPLYPLMPPLLGPPFSNLHQSQRWAEKVCIRQSASTSSVIKILAYSWARPTRQEHSINPRTRSTSQCPHTARPLHHIMTSHTQLLSHPCDSPAACAARAFAMRRSSCLSLLVTPNSEAVAISTHVATSSKMTMPAAQAACTAQAKRSVRVASQQCVHACMQVVKYMR